MAGGAVRPILELAGIRDILAKSLGSPNAINAAWATMACLKSIRVADEVCKMRGKSLDDLVPWLAKKLADQNVSEVGEEVETVEVVEAGAVEGRDEDAEKL